MADSAILSHDDHADRMNRMYRYQRHIYDLTRKYYLLGRDRAIERLGLPHGGRLLEVGCGTGRNLLLAGRHYPQARLFGLDISEEMLNSARANFRAAATPPEFRAADATAFRPADFDTDGFDRILISYALSMIPDWEQAIEASLTSLSPGGSLHIVDFGQQEGLPRWFHRMLCGWLARFHVTPRADLERVIRMSAEKRGALVEFERLGRGYAWHAIIRT